MRCYSQSYTCSRSSASCFSTKQYNYFLTIKISIPCARFNHRLLGNTKDATNTMEFFEDGTISETQKMSPYTQQTASNAGDYRFIDNDHVRIKFIFGEQVFRIAFINDKTFTMSDNSGEQTTYTKR